MKRTKNGLFIFFTMFFLFSFDMKHSPIIHHSPLLTLNGLSLMFTNITQECLQTFHGPMI